METLSRRFLSALVGVSVAVLIWFDGPNTSGGEWVAGNEEHLRVSPEEFDMLMKSPVGDTRDVSFIGAASDRVYLSEWRLIGAAEVIRVCSASVSDMPRELSTQLRQGIDPWRDMGRSNDPGLTGAEIAAIDRRMRYPPQLPVRLVLRLSADRVMAARDHFDGRFTEENVLPIPIPCDLVVLVSGDEQSGWVSVNGEPWISHAGRGVSAEWMHLAEPGDLEVAVTANGWTRLVTLRGIKASQFYASKEAQARSKR